MDKLSEKEKKAIDYYINNEYSFGFETDMDIESFKKAIGIEETDEDTWEKHQIRFKTLLNLIDRQQKEIEKEKEKNEELLNEKLEVKISVSAHNQIRQLQNELQQEKEKNKELENELQNKNDKIYKLLGQIEKNS